MLRPRMRSSRVICLLFLCGFLVISIQAKAQGQSAPTEAETIKALLRRVDQLEAEVNALKTKTRGDTNTNPTAISEVPMEAKPDTEQAANVTPIGSHSMDQTSAMRLRIRGYGDIGWRGTDEKGATNAFSLGQLNLFMTSQLSDNLSFLAETVIEADQATNEFGIEAERLLLIYNAGDWLNLSFGRYHTGIGYYNTAYHHSALMQTTFGRPFLFDFEDAGGILPIHNVGISATGTISSKYGVHYIAEIGNGRSTRAGSNPVQNVSDINNGKAFNLALFVRPPGLRGAEFGFSAYHDHLTLPAGPNTKENIVAAYAVYQTSRFEFLNEAVLMRHALDKSNLTINIPGFYSQISRRWGNYRPYLRYEYLNVSSRDPFYSDVGLLHGPKLGLRYDFGEFAAFKMEYGRAMRRGVSSVNSVGTQLSFAF